MINGNFTKKAYIKPMILGFKEEYIGKGTTVRLIFKVKKLHKDNVQPVIIDVASEKNVKLYQKFNFKIFKKDESLGFPIHFLRLNQIINKRAKKISPFPFMK